MPRIQGVGAERAGLLVRFIYRLTSKKIGQLTGKAEVVEPVRIMAHHPRILMSFGAMDAGLEGAKTVPVRYTHLAFAQSARMIGCPF